MLSSASLNSHDRKTIASITVEESVILLLSYLSHNCLVFIKIDLDNVHESILKNISLSTNIRFYFIIPVVIDKHNL